MEGEACKPDLPWKGKPNENQAHVQAMAGGAGCNIFPDLTNSGSAVDTQAGGRGHRQVAVRQPVSNRTDLMAALKALLIAGWPLC